LHLRREVQPADCGLRIADCGFIEVPMTDLDPDVHRHPVGTLAIVGLYGVLFAVGWLLVYVYVYLARGPVTP
jgi:hypothetical protein